MNAAPNSFSLKDSNTMYWEREHETMPRERLEQLQLERLKTMLKRVYRSVPFYRDALQKRGLEPGDIRSLEDLKSLPFTYKQDLRDNYPYGLFTVPLSDIVRLHASSGTTGKPSVVGYTRRDIENWQEVVDVEVEVSFKGSASKAKKTYSFPTDKHFDNHLYTGSYSRSIVGH